MDKDCSCVPCDACITYLDDIEAKLQAAEVERDAANYQLREQNQKLDAANLAVESLRDDL